MERPTGVTVLACLYLLVAFLMLIALVPSETFNPLRQPRLLALTTGNLIVEVTLGIALLKMKGWSRWLAIIASALQLLPFHMKLLFHSPVVIIRAGLRTLFFVWVAWYLTRPQIKAAFQGS